MQKIKLHEKWTDEDRKYVLDYECYLLKELPHEREYFDFGKDKGYVISINQDEIVEEDYVKYTMYYEKNLDDWAKQNIDVAEVCSICIKKSTK